MTLILLTKKFKDLLRPHLCLFVFDEIYQRGHKVSFFLYFKYKSKFKIFNYMHQFLKILKNTYSIVTLIPEMKSGTPKTYIFDIKYWSIKQFVKAFDELVLRLFLPS